MDHTSPARRMWANEAVGTPRTFRRVVELAVVIQQITAFVFRTGSPAKGRDIMGSHVGLVLWK